MLDICYLAYATCEPPKMAQFDWFTIYIGQYPMIEISNSGYCFHCKMLKTNKPLIKTNKARQKVLSCLFLEGSHVVYTKTIIHHRLRE